MHPFVCYCPPLAGEDRDIHVSILHLYETKKYRYFCERTKSAKRSYFGCLTCFSAQAVAGPVAGTVRVLLLGLLLGLLEV